ncbi:hypothetical protein K502DRAFT_323254 [Neoconidiobolus thromboides FSU 785]|nr:hypothetical protein K502DRAFT_323254 [Neoconidiobolus thromboides FSU 785]
MEESFNITILSDLIGYRIDSMELLIEGFKDLSKKIKFEKKEVIQETITKLSLSGLFSLIISDGAPLNLTEAVAELLKIYFDTLSVEFLFTKEFRLYLINGLSSSHIAVRELTLDQLLRVDYGQEIPFDKEILYLIFECLKFEEIIIADKAGLLIQAITKSEKNFESIMKDNEIIKKLERLTKNSITQIRTIELLLKLLLNQENQFELRFKLLQENLIVNQLFPINLIKNQSDLLLRLNLMELYIKFIPDSNFQQLLLKNEILEFLISSYPLTTIPAVNEWDPLLLTSDLKLIGLANSHLVQSNEITNLSTKTINLFLFLLQQDINVELKISCLKAITCMAQTYHGVLLLTNNHSLMKLLANAFFYLVGDARIIGLNCLSSIFGVDKQPNEKLSAGCEILTDYLQEYLKIPFDILRYCSNPSVEIKIAAYRLLYTISLHRFGCELIMNDKKSMDKLLDRNMESELEGLKWKYSIINNLATNASLNIISPQLKEQLDLYLKQGIVYSTFAPRVELDMA